MKAILEFNLDNPEDVMAHKRATKATDMALVLFEITHNRKKLWLNYDHKLGEDSSYGENLIHEIFDDILNLLDGHGIVIDDIVE